MVVRSSWQAMIAAAKEQPKQVAAVRLPPPPALPAGQVEAERARQQAAADMQQPPRRTPPHSRPSPAHDSSQDTSQQAPSGSMRSKCAPSQARMLTLNRLLLGACINCCFHMTHIQQRNLACATCRPRRVLTSTPCWRRARTPTTPTTSM